MRMNDSWGIQLDALNSLHEKGCKEVRILETEENKIYSASFDKIFEEGITEDFGDGMQVFLPRSEWKITKNK